MRERIHQRPLKYLAVQMRFQVYARARRPTAEERVLFGETTQLIDVPTKIIGDDETEGDGERVAQYPEWYQEPPLLLKEFETIPAGEEEIVHPQVIFHWLGGNDDEYMHEFVVLSRIYYHLRDNIQPVMTVVDGYGNRIDLDLPLSLFDVFKSIIKLDAMIDYYMQHGFEHWVHTWVERKFELLDGISILRVIREKLMLFPLPRVKTMYDSGAFSLNSVNFMIEDKIH